MIARETTPARGRDSFSLGVAVAKDRPPSFQFYPRDFLADSAVRAMTLEARGAYISLLCTAWESDEPGVLPDDDEFLANVSDARDRWPALRAQVARAFTVRGGTWTQRRMVEERREQKARFASAKEAGRVSGVVRRAKGANETRTECERIANGMATPASASASAYAVESKAKIAAAAAPIPASVAEPPTANGTAPPAPPTPAEASAPEADPEARRREAGRAVVALAAGLRMPASVTGKLDVDRVAKAAASLGPAGVKTAIQLAQRWWKAGLRHEGLLDRLVAEYVARHASIGNPFAYFNGPAFAAMRLRWGGELSEAEAKEIRMLERRFLAEAARAP